MHEYVISALRTSIAIFITLSYLSVLTWIHFQDPSRVTCYDKVEGMKTTVSWICYKYEGTDAYKPGHLKCDWVTSKVSHKQKYRFSRPRMMQIYREVWIFFPSCLELELNKKLPNMQPFLETYQKHFWQNKQTNFTYSLYWIKVSYN